MLELIGRGRQQLRSEVRDGLRSIVDSPELSAYLCEVIAPHLPRTTSSWQGEAHLEGLNERCRFLVYKPGHYFAPHCDGQYTRPNGDCSRITVQLYLHDVPVEAVEPPTLSADEEKKRLSSLAAAAL